jgi:ketosteroid isomerase-like protein
MLALMRIEDPTARAVWEFVEALNAAWLGGRAEDLGDFLSEDVVLVAPGWADRLEGQRAAVASYAEFTALASGLEFSPSDPQIDIFGNVAVVSYAFTLTCRMDDGPHRDEGRDLFVLRREEGWRAVWRTIVVT